MDDELYLIQIKAKTGEVVMEAPLRVYDPEKAMAFFLDAFASGGQAWPGMLLKGMMLATSSQNTRGAVISLQEQGGPQIVIPNGMPPRGGY